MPSALLDHALANLDTTIRRLEGEFDRDLLERLRHPKERIEIHLSPQLEDRKIHVFQAFAVRHSDALGPCKGGIRLSAEVTLDDVTGLAMEMTWKCALIGVPFGGGKSGIVADPASLSPADKERVVRSFARNATRHIHPLVYVPAPDMGTNERDMGYIKDTVSYSLGWSTTQGCYVTGKPVVLGGIPGRREATGRGVAASVAEAMAVLGRPVEGATAIVQGFGNVGSVAAVALHERGVRIIGVSDVSGAVFRAAGLDLEALKAYAERSGTVAGFPGGEPIDGRHLLEQACDILVPAATGNQIAAENAARIRAALVAEGANGPTTPDADRILRERGVFVIPDILCNAGGVFVSYLEYTQETQQEQIGEDEVRARLHARMKETFGRVFRLSRESGLSMRDAAMLTAVRNVCEALVARGYQP
ncbi:MAG: Glu/Leu/Phe/Val dehydrogenase [Planctomycetes bacterium]|nr:Glu/Leu/Phe/Val dehydrogenase [Planctomycetota bacterium]